MAAQGDLEVLVQASTTVTATKNSGELTVPKDKGVKGVAIFVDVTANAGTSETLDITVERFDHASSKWLAIVGAALAQIGSSIGQIDLVIYPGVTVVANRALSDHIGNRWRIVSTIGGSAGQSLTYSIGVTYLV